MAEKFHSAARDGYLDLLRNANRKEMNTTDEDGRTPAMVAAQHGNLDALRVIVMRGGNVNKLDLLGYSTMHHACRNGHMNCVTFLVNYGADFWIMDNDMHSPLDVAALENYEDIVKYLDEVQMMQMQKNPKFVQQQKEKAMREAERNLKMYEREQDRASKEMARQRRRREKQDSIQNGDFKPPSSSFVKKLSNTLRMKGNTAKSKTKPANAVSAFSDLTGTSRGTSKKLSVANGTEPQLSIYDFHVSETDPEGKRTLKSVKGTVVSKNAQVLYTNTDDNVAATDYSARKPLTNIFPGTSLDKANWNKVNSDSNLDSGVDSFESGNYEDETETPGMFNRPGMGEISFLKSFNPMQSFQTMEKTSTDETDSGLVNGTDHDGENDSDPRTSGGSYFSGENEETEGQSLPWKDEDVDPLDDDEEDDEYTPVVVFLEACKLSYYIPLFTNGDVDMDALMHLTNQDFADMGLPIGPRRKLMDAIQRRRVVLSEPAQMYDTQL